MSSDPDLRARLQRLARDVDPDVEERLERTRVAARRGDRRSQLGLLLQTAAVAAVVLVVVVQIAGRPSGPASNEPPQLHGSWTATIASTDPSATGAGLVGPWTLGFPTTGVLDVDPQAGFSAPHTGYSFRQTGDAFRTDLLGESVCSGIPPGTYRLQLTGDELRFVLIDDVCRARALLLTSTPWMPVR
jgi:hypothetical protein